MRLRCSRGELGLDDGRLASRHCLWGGNSVPRAEGRHHRYRALRCVLLPGHIVVAGIEELLLKYYEIFIA